MTFVSRFDFEFIPSQIPSPHLMIVFHGQADSIKPFFSIDQELGLTQMNYLLLNAPRKYHSGYSWYAEPPLHKRGIARTRYLLIESLRELQWQGWKPENIFLFGFSQGGQVAYDLAIQSGYRFAGVIGISSYFVFFGGWRERITLKAEQTPWLVVHGTKDRVLPLSNTLFGVRKLKNAGLNVTSKVLEKAHKMVDEDLLIVQEWVSSKFQIL